MTTSWYNMHYFSNSNRILPALDNVFHHVILNHLQFCYKQLDGVRGCTKEIHIGVALCDDENIHGTLDGVRGKYRVQLWRRLYSSCWDSKMHFLQWPMLINKTLSLRVAEVRTSFSTAQLHCGGEGRMHQKKERIDQAPENSWKFSVRHGHWNLA